MNVFIDPKVAEAYDTYYQTEVGRKVNDIEEKLILKILKDLPKTEMLELGCGTGHWTNVFINQGFNVTALDISDEMLKYAHSKNLNAQFIKADSENIPFPENSYSLISSITMLEFVNDQDQVLEEIYRVLKPGGNLVLGCLNAHSELGKNKENDPSFRNAKFLSPQELEEKLKLFGNPQLSFGVHLSPNFEIKDGTQEMYNTEPAFIAALVQKTK